MADALDLAGVAGVGVIGTGLGAAVLKLAQTFLEKRAARPSPMKDAADLVNAAATFQAHLHVAAEGIVLQLRGEIEQMKLDHAGEIASLKRAHEQCEADARRIEGDLNNQRQVTESLARELRRAGIDVSDLTGVRPLIMLEASVPQGQDK
jgi:hypothetical protein